MESRGYGISGSLPASTALVDARTPTDSREVTKNGYTSAKFNSATLSGFLKEVNQKLEIEEPCDWCKHLKVSQNLTISRRHQDIFRK